jgi:hypothetical protein
MSVEGTMGSVISALVSLSQRKLQNSMHLGCNLRRSVNTFKSLQINQEYLFVSDIFEKNLYIIAWSFRIKGVCNCKCSSLGIHFSYKTLYLSKPATQYR